MPNDKKKSAASKQALGKDESDDFVLPVAPPVVSSAPSKSETLPSQSKVDSGSINYIPVTNGKSESCALSSSLEDKVDSPTRPLWVQHLGWFPLYWVMCALFGFPIGGAVFGSNNMAIGGFFITTGIALIFYCLGLLVEYHGCPVEFNFSF